MMVNARILQNTCPGKLLPILHLKQRKKQFLLKSILKVVLGVLLEKGTFDCG
jgi:hypothetical protein